MIWRAKNDIVFRNKDCPFKRLSLFLYIFFLETKSFFVDGPTILVNFIDHWAQGEMGMDDPLWTFFF